jgi:hypothetical protein
MIEIINQTNTQNNIATTAFAYFEAQQRLIFFVDSDLTQNSPLPVKYKYENKVATFLIFFEFISYQLQ